jgi:hypothetical protein
MTGVKGKRILVALAVSALTLSFSSCSSVHDSKPLGKVSRSSDPSVQRQISYAKAHYKNPNKETFGDLGGTDCVNFTSQTLFARGWPLTADWTYKNGYSRAWISSTGFRDYLAQHPELATPLDWAQRSRVSVGDVVQFDWDASGDRDHTGVISGIETRNGKRELLVTSHSPAAFDWPITDVIAEHGAPTKVYFWHIKKSA